MIVLVQEAQEIQQRGQDLRYWGDDGRAHAAMVEEVRAELYERRRMLEADYAVRRFTHPYPPVVIRAVCITLTSTQDPLEPSLQVGVGDNFWTPSGSEFIPYLFWPPRDLSRGKG